MNVRCRQCTPQALGTGEGAETQRGEHGFLVATEQMPLRAKTLPRPPRQGSQVAIEPRSGVLASCSRLTEGHA